MSRRNINAAVARPEDGFSKFKVADMADSTNVGYSKDGVPLYDIAAYFGPVGEVINSADNAYESHMELRDDLKNGESAISVSVFEDREVFSLATMHQDKVFYYGFLHKKGGQAITTGKLVFAEVVLNRDFKVPDSEVILPKGKKYFKALPVEYILKCKAA